jgi:pyruvate,water dikinase
MGEYVLTFDEIGQSQVPEVGGKGAHLGELSRIEGIDVPPGFCVTTAAFQRIMSQALTIDRQLDALSLLAPDDRDAIRAQSEKVRSAIEAITIPDDIAVAITGALDRLGANTACAVRSSATAEDLPSASFAGQQDSYLNVTGRGAILAHISRCWASLFTERAVTYRLRNGFDHRKVHMAVVVQQMVSAEASGILFTADPISGNRKVSAIEAALGLGEALVSGLVNADVFKVRDGKVTTKTIQQDRPTLTDAQLLQLEKIGRRIEAHFGCPQDIDWCLADDVFRIVQSRPITTLFPVPENDGGNHVYVSVGHQQMMTDPMKPLGLSVWQLTTPAGMAEAGGRLFVDVTKPLGTSSREALLNALGKSDPLIRDALESVLDRGDFIPSLPDSAPPWVPPGSGSDAIPTDPAIVTELIERSDEFLARAQREIATKSGSDVFDFILDDIQTKKKLEFDPRSLQVIMAGMEAAFWLNDKMQEWLGEKNVADVLTQSVPNNVTSEMGLALMDVADAIRPHAKVIAYLEGVRDEHFLDELPKLPGGRESRHAIVDWLDKYGMRGPGEIDITRPRWSERPSMLLPVILGNIRNFEAGAAKRRFEEGKQAALKKKEELLARLRALPDGETKAQETERKIDRVWTFAGYREYPKYRMIGRYFIYKQALMKEADRLVQAGVLRDREDVFFLRIQELQEVVRTQQSDEQLIQQRKDAFKSYAALTAPRVLTSEGEGINGSYRRDDIPAGALVGLAVSAGTIEGRARVILDMAKADLEPGDILVTAYTDPSWTPLFVAIAGLVTEVGGLMTHGAVIAREYGLPAVVGVGQATRLIADGQRIRVHGTEGYVEILP